MLFELIRPGRYYDLKHMDDKRGIEVARGNLVT
jgi:hypothetical protein